MVLHFPASHRGIVAWLLCCCCCRPYHLGETVAGEVVLDYRSEITARSIAVKLRAVEYFETGSGNSASFCPSFLLCCCR